MALIKKSEHASQVLVWRRKKKETSAETGEGPLHQPVPKADVADDSKCKATVFTFTLDTCHSTTLMLWNDSSKNLWTFECLALFRQRFSNDAIKACPYITLIFSLCTKQRQHNIYWKQQWDDVLWLAFRPMKCHNDQWLWVLTASHYMPV